MKTIIAALGMAAGAMAAAPAVAGDVTGGSALLDDGRQAQLERWLGAGEFNLDNVYTLRAGDTSADFHAGADGKGATFTLLEVTNAAGAQYLVGGYNPQSWASDEGWHETERDWQRTAFLFNFTRPAVYRQIPSTYILPSQGRRQTFNDTDFGPVFGSGPDLFVNDRLDTALSWQLSYGNPADESASIVDRSLRGQTVRIDAMEIFAISPVPEPGGDAMLLLGIGALGWFGLTGRKRTCRA
ncbi:PEP_CTERM-anchored TLD domain-containing protein [Massilia forsythiae]|nr:PEP_CTERM-anchored TLD domain-containing protein [Massilia forsythiae]